MSEGIVQEGHYICTSEWQMLSAILKANTVCRPVETGRKIQYNAPLRRVAKDQDCSAPNVGEDLLSIRGPLRPFQKQIQYSAPLRRVAKYSIAPC